jgi:tripartite-type tricarboxylate transporter receptor subunit TctC
MRVDLIKATTRSLAALLVAAMALVGPAAAADTIKLIVTFAAGGPADMLARLLAQDLQSRLGANIVVDNRGGAGGAMANEAAAKSPADGKTLLLGSMGSQVINPALRPPTGYDPVKSLEPVVLIGSVPSLLVIRKELPVNSLVELVAYGKQGNKLSYGSAGPGTTMNIAGEMLNTSAGIRTTHVPYRGAGPAINDLLGGHIDLLIADLPVLLPLVGNDTVRPLALFGSRRSPLLPNVATSSELGFPDMAMENWYGIFAPAGIPKEVQAALEQAILETIQTPLVQERLAAGGMFGTKDGAAFKARLDRDFAYWGPAIVNLGISAE